VIFHPSEERTLSPQRFLSLEEVRDILGPMRIKQAIFMGAEASIDPELPELARFLHQEFHSHNVLLTNGLGPAPLDDVDEVVFSIKAYAEELHRNYTGVSGEGCLANFVLLHWMGVRLRAETIFIPDYVDYAEIEDIAKFIATVDPEIPYRIDAYLPVGDSPWRRPTPNEMEKACAVAGKYLKNVSCLRGNEPLAYEVERIF
jgi:pyruvate-formate lyase-activating enzyme